MRALPSRVLLIAAAGAVCLVAPGVSPALGAGSYVVSSCSPATSPGAWTSINTAPAGFAVGQACGGPAVGPVGAGDPGSLYAEDILNSPADIPSGAVAGWTFTAPAGTTISAITYYRALATYVTNDLVAGLFGSGPAGPPLEECVIARPLGSPSTCAMPNNQTPVTFAGLATGSLFFGVGCRIVDLATACIDGGAPLHDAQAELYSAKVTLAESVLPTLGPPGGALWGGGVVFGAVPVSLSASDPSGIAQYVVRADSGQTIASGSQTCDFTSVVPCPQLAAGQLSADTTQVPDGPHTFTASAIDAAGNTGSSPASSRVVVDNNGPPAPSGLHATASLSSSPIGLSWTNPASPPEPVTGAMAQLCPAVGACGAPVALAASGSGQLPAAAAGAYTVRLWLVDAAGRGGPANAAVASVTVPAAGGGGGPGSSTPPAGGKEARSKIVATIVGRRLRVSGTIAPAIGLVTVSWRSRHGIRTLGRGARLVAVDRHAFRVTFTLSHRQATGTIGVAARTGSLHVLAGARARRGDLQPTSSTR
jgi:hypothetical protein